jgi:hypothetical protein
MVEYLIGQAPDALLLSLKNLRNMTSIAQMRFDIDQRREKLACYREI